MQPLPPHFSDLTLRMPRTRRSRSAASPPLPEDLPPSAGAAVPVASAVSAAVAWLISTLVNPVGWFPC
jgi:hypothetical protein